MAQVFISHSSKDRRYMEELRDRLNKRKRPGLNVEIFTDQNIEPGENWYETLREELADSDICVFLMSENFVNAPWAPIELDRVIERGGLSTRPLPFNITSCNWINSYPRLREFQSVTDILEKADDKEGVWNAWVDAIFRAANKCDAGRDSISEDIPLEDAIRTGVERGTFTPLLGPFCFELKDNRARAKEFLINRIHRLLRHDEMQGDANQGDANQQVRDYVLSIFKAYYPDVPNRDLIPPRRTSLGRGPEDRWTDALTSFQVSLAHVGFEACQIIASELKRSPVGLVSLRSADMYPSEGHMGNMKDSLDDAVQKATELVEVQKEMLNKESEARCGSFVRMLKVPAIKRQLKATALSILGSLLSDEWGTANASKPKLSTVHLEWISDLLWYTIRFDAPMYPTDYELAFQLTFASTTGQYTHRPHREPLGTVGYYARTRTGISEISRWFKHYANGSALQSEFYVTTARALCHSIGKGSGELPIAISTNFDNDLEQILRSRNHPFSTLVPVYIGAGSIESSDQYWLLCVADGKKPTNEDNPYTSWRLLGASSGTKKLEGFAKGPLIVRLHGAPMIDLPAMEDVDIRSVPDMTSPRKKVINHRLILWDYDILDWLTDTNSWPSALRKLLASRLLFFLGYRLKDADNRLKIFDQTRPGKTSDGTETQRSIYLIDHQRVDSIHKTYLRRPRMEPVGHDPESFVGLILEIENLYSFE
ncbi:MAG: toll/interleukin-1 receptor domain-containing protein [bacterium]|nr:toll/interleukin-1 receptor domain-containing protein [bacterium]